MNGENFNNALYRHSFRYGAGILLVVAGIAANGCSGDKTANVKEPVYASVNGVDLTESGLRASVPPEFYDRLTRDHRLKIIQDWIDKELLYQEAVKKGIDTDPTIERLLLESRKNLLSNELLERELSTLPKPDDAVLEKYFNEHTDYFLVPTDEYRVRYALFDSRNDATVFHRQVKGNVAFSDLAKELSKDPSSRDGGNLGVVNQETVEPAIWDNISSTISRYGLGKISDIFQVTDGWGTLIVDEEIPAGSVKPFLYVKDAVLDLYMADQRETAQQQLLDSLREKAKITVADEGK